MALEIERKFLVDIHKLPTLPQGKHIRQGYLSIASNAVVRVRLYGAEAYLTVKGASEGIQRSEYEYAIPYPDGLEMLNNLCGQPQIEKVRYLIPFQQHTWELDIFSADNAGLIVAEIELTDTNESFTLPPWVTTEVSDDPRYRNSSLIAYPFGQWTSENFT